MAQSIYLTNLFYLKCMYFCWLLYRSSACKNINPVFSRNDDLDSVMRGTMRRLYPRIVTYYYLLLLSWVLILNSTNKTSKWGLFLFLLITLYEKDIGRCWGLTGELHPIILREDHIKRDGAHWFHKQLSRLWAGDFGENILDPLL